MKTKTNKQTKEKYTKIIQLLTVAPELLTLDRSLTHVLQAPNTVKSWMDWGYV